MDTGSLLIHEQPFECAIAFQLQLLFDMWCAFEYSSFQSSFFSLLFFLLYYMIFFLYEDSAGPHQIWMEHFSVLWISYR